MEQFNHEGGHCILLLYRPSCCRKFSSCSDYLGNRFLFCMLCCKLSMHTCEPTRLNREYHNLTNITQLPWSWLKNHDFANIKNVSLLLYVFTPRYANIKQVYWYNEYAPRTVTVIWPVKRNNSRPKSQCKSPTSIFHYSIKLPRVRFNCVILRN